MLYAHSMIEEEVLGAGRGGHDGAEREKKKEDEESDAYSWLIMKLWVVS